MLTWLLRFCFGVVYSEWTENGRWDENFMENVGRDIGTVGTVPKKRYHSQ
jgi:hypothetical protein